MKAQITKGCKIVTLLIGVLFILLAGDAFSLDLPWYERLFGFVISTIPGVLLILLVYFLWNKEFYLGVILTLLGGIMIWFFGVFEEFPERLGTLFVVMPVLLAGVVLLVYGKQKE